MKKIRVLLITVSFIRKNRGLKERDKIKMMTGGDYYGLPGRREAVF
jgi:hypothetical protein